LLKHKSHDLLTEKEATEMALLELQQHGKAVTDRLKADILQEDKTIQQEQVVHQKYQKLAEEAKSREQSAVEKKLKLEDELQRVESLLLTDGRQHQERHPTDRNRDILLLWKEAMLMNTSAAGKQQGPTSPFSAASSGHNTDRSHWSSSSDDGSTTNSLSGTFNLVGSSLVSQQQLPIVEQWLQQAQCPGISNGKLQWKLLYKGSRDGFAAKDFHRCCDGKGETLTVISSKQGNIFGGYYSKSWTGQSGSMYDPQAFLFSLVNHLQKPVLIKQKLDNGHAVWDNSTHGPTFGGGFDLYVDDSMNNVNGSSFSNLGASYDSEAALGYSFDSTEAKSFLAGSYQFAVVEIEVFVPGQ
jgi:hypothetical protein